MIKPTKELLSKLIDEAIKHKLQPIRYPSTRVYKIKQGQKKGYYNLLPNTTPRKNGAFHCFVMILSNRRVKNFINNNWQGDYILISAPNTNHNKEKPNERINRTARPKTC